MQAMDVDSQIAYPISIQWHITTDCQNNCRHCYVFDPATYAHERDFGLTLEQKLLAMDKLDAFGKKWGFCFPDVILMGGDPLLARDWYEFAMALRKRGKKIAFGGNPESLTAENLNKLKQLDVKRFQLSLDGLEEAHDQQRRPGSFKNTIEGLSRLKKAGIHGSVMATLTPINVEDFWHLLDFVFYETDAYRFAFEFVSRVGNAHGLDVRFTPEQVLALASKYLDIKNTRATERPEFSFVEKPGLFRLLHMARGEIARHDEGDTAMAHGCLIGHDCICILSDGTMLSCRRFPEIIGRLPDDEPEDILLKAETLKRYRRPQFWTDCGQCVGWNWCRGCPAQSFGECGDPFVKPEVCFAHLLGMDKHCDHAGIPMDISLAEEAGLIKQGLRHVYANALATGTLDKDIPGECLRLYQDGAAAAEFLRNPAVWFASKHPSWEKEERYLFTYRFNEFCL